ncbi:hypothetical protein C6I21_09165 [Alkalicoccus urumqiensis]|uniref:Uncharacterized protein n=1 Tax=Alkalicoccus urumqiensis TaxID=1548213 RepID=A0A2P6MHD9_ALKUR|nr:hypothetical protein C6I21_09165 [Alkalicoccus urumqiensis]
MGLAAAAMGLAPAVVGLRPPYNRCGRSPPQSSAFEQHTAWISGAAGVWRPVDGGKLDSAGALWESVREKWESEYWKWDFPAAVRMDTPVIGMPP